MVKRAFWPTGLQKYGLVDELQMQGDRISSDSATQIRQIITCNFLPIWPKTFVLRWAFVVCAKKKLLALDISFFIKCMKCLAVLV